MEKVNQDVQLVDVALFRNKLEDARSLILEYANSVGIDLCFQNFDQEIASLPGDYSPPNGALFIVSNRDRPLGCVALRKISNETCEMKRLYVKPDYRGRGIGRLLATSVIERARKIGYRTIRLDTLPSMKEAISMYFKMGFKTIEAYRPNPVSGILYLELEL